MMEYIAKAKRKLFQICFISHTSYCLKPLLRSLFLQYNTLLPMRVHEQ